MPSSRNASIDHIRILLTGLVIAHHCAISYGGSGGWYWREAPSDSNLLLVAFNALNQSFFMGFFFLLAGYYTPPSFERKGSARFLADRFLRLGIPLVAYSFILSPFTIALANHPENTHFLETLKRAYASAVFEPGPLWFAEALLILALIYAVVSKFWTKPITLHALPRVSTLALLSVSLAAIAFAIRLAYPTGTNFLWLQLGYFPCYVFLFATGCAASRSKFLENLSIAQVRPWVIISIVSIISLPIVMATRMGKGAFEGGWTFNAAYYALWDPFTAWGIILGMLWFFRQQFNRSNALTAWLARRAYGAYIVHPPVLVALGLAFYSTPITPFLKFLLITPLAIAASFLTTSLLLRIPYAQKIL